MINFIFFFFVKNKNSTKLDSATDFSIHA